MSDVEKRELAAEREERAAEREAIERELAAQREERERELVAEREAIASKERELTMLREIDALQTSLHIEQVYGFAPCGRGSGA